jgi:hypothetical protein
LADKFNGQSSQKSQLGKPWEARNIYRNNLLIFDRGGRGTVIAGQIEESRGTFRQLAQVSLLQAEPFKPAVIAKASPRSESDSRATRKSMARVGSAVVGRLVSDMRNRPHGLRVDDFARVRNADEDDSWGTRRNALGVVRVFNSDRKDTLGKRKLKRDG